MARLKIAYIGGGSSRAPGTAATWVAQAENFAGSEIVLIDLDIDRLNLVQRLATNMARAAGADLRFTVETSLERGLAGCDAVLTSFRPGGFEARYLDEFLPLRRGVIGQETQGPGGFFMALRSIEAIKPILAAMSRVCPKAWLFNYTNPVNIVGQAISTYSDIPFVSLCEGPIIFPEMLARAARLDPAKLDVSMVGLNHGSWSVRHLHDGEDFIAKISHRLDAIMADPAIHVSDKRMAEISVNAGSVAAQYFQYYHYTQEIVKELQASKLTRAQVIMASIPSYWEHYREQAEKDAPMLDPALSRGGVNELELAIDVMDAMFNDRREVWPVNVANQGAIGDFDDDLVVEVPGFVDRAGIRPLASGRLPQHVAGLTHALAEFQRLTAAVGWEGDRRSGIRALASNPLVPGFALAEALYDEMAQAHRAYLPERLLS